MNFAEIMHFFRSEDVTSLKSRKKHEAEWKKKNSRWNYLLHQVGNVNVDQHWEYPKRCRLVMYLALAKAVRFDH
jgi:hypothetical protein